MESPGATRSAQGRSSNPAPRGEVVIGNRFGAFVGAGTCLVGCFLGATLLHEAAAIAMDGELPRSEVAWRLLLALFAWTFALVALRMNPLDVTLAEAGVWVRYLVGRRKLVAWENVSWTCWPDANGMRLRLKGRPFSEVVNLTGRRDVLRGAVDSLREHGASGEVRPGPFPRGR